MIMTLVVTFAILAALAIGFVSGRIWQIRCDEVTRREGFAPPPIARIPLPKDAELSRRAPA
jgi:hypothetical protein